MVPLSGLTARRAFPVVTALLLSALATVQTLSIRRETQTWDEGFEIASGYAFLRTGEYRISPEHPPFARILAAAPLLALNPRVPVDHPTWTIRDDRWFGNEFMFHNRVPADTILFAARAPTIVTTLVLGFVLSWWTRRVFGPAAAMVCLFLFALDPNVIANGRYVKGDMLVTLFALVAAAAWLEYLLRGGKRWLIAAGAVLGLAVGTKFSALFLVPVFATSWAVVRAWRGEPLRIGRGVQSVAIACAVAFPVLLAIYAPESGKLIPATRAYRAAHPEVRRIGDTARARTPLMRAAVDAGTHAGVQDHPLLVGLAHFLDHSSSGHESYLMGRISTEGTWYYFPVAFAVKTPVAAFAAILAAAIVAARRVLKRGFRPRSDTHLYALLCLIPLAVYLPLSILNRVNTGERHLLPVYPFLFALTGAIMARTSFRGRAVVATFAAVGLAAESFAIYPHYLAFFNVAAGGPAAGPRYLLDSNLDWGQDLLKVRDYWEAKGRPRLCLLYFGTADPDYYRIPYDRVPRSWETAERNGSDCLAAVSATSLYDLYLRPGEMAWLRTRTPMDRIGYSIYVYDLRKSKSLDDQ